MMQAIVYSRTDEEGICLTTKPQPKTNSSSHLICRVAYAGVNPVDVKFLVGDKLPKWCLGLGRWAVDGRTVGFDFSGTVVQAASGDSRFKIGDAVYGTAPPGVGTFCEVFASLLGLLQFVTGHISSLRVHK
jgi:NADPH:quinone reductase-like Zn-dependent oxidoreductase